MRSRIGVVSAGLLVLVLASVIGSVRKVGPVATAAIAIAAVALVWVIAWWSTARRRRWQVRMASEGRPSWYALVAESCTPWAGTSSALSWIASAGGVSAQVTLDSGRLRFRPTWFPRMTGFADWDLPVEGLHSLASVPTGPRGGAIRILPSRDRVTMHLASSDRGQHVSLDLDGGQAFIAAVQSSRDRTPGGQ